MCQIAIRRAAIDDVALIIRMIALLSAVLSFIVTNPEEQVRVEYNSNIQTNKGCGSFLKSQEDSIQEHQWLKLGGGAYKLDSFKDYLQNTDNLFFP